MILTGDPAEPKDDSDRDEIDNSDERIDTALRWLSYGLQDRQRAQDRAKKACDDLAKERGSYNAMIDSLHVLLAWEAGEITETQALKAIGKVRVETREERYAAIKNGVRIVKAMEMRERKVIDARARLAV